MDKFKIGQTEIKGEGEIYQKRQIRSVDEGKTLDKKSLKNFEAPTLDSHRLKDYSAIKEKFGALSLMDLEKQTAERKDQKFQINSIMGESLSVFKEQERMVENLVQKRLDELEKSVKEKAYKEGYNAGLEKGKAEATAKYSKEMEMRVQLFDQFLKFCEMAKKEIIQANERLILETIFSISRQVLLKEIQHDTEYLLRLCSEMVERTGARENIRLKIHPGSMEMLGDLRKGLEERFSGLRNLSIDVSDEVIDGGCMVDTDWMRIDASLKAQFDLIHEELLGKKGEDAA